MPNENDKIRELQPARPLERSKLAFFIYKKLERITTALYVITALLSDSEPIKWELREKALHLLSDSAPGREAPMAARVQSRIEPLLEEILALLFVAQQAGLVSQMNVGVIKDQYEKIRSLFVETAEGNGVDLAIPDDFFVLSLSAAGSKKTQQNGQKAGSYSINDIKRTKSVSKGHSIMSVSKRHNDILDSLSRHKEATINDIKASIKDVSEKTIQRDLATLIKEGRVRRNGLRRWARYSLS